jgi:hypothetical protein
MRPAMSREPIVTARLPAAVPVIAVIKVCRAFKLSLVSEQGYAVVTRAMFQPGMLAVSVETRVGGIAEVPALRYDQWIEFGS